MSELANDIKNEATCEVTSGSTIGVVGAEPLGVEGAEPLAEPLVELIMRQTTYDQLTAAQKLKHHKNDVMQVIREYMKPDKPTHNNNNTPFAAKLSTNQQIYKEIRTMMDDAAKKYELEKSKQN